MSNFITMVNRIADDLTRDDLQPQIKQAINDAIKTWEGQRFGFNEVRYSLPTVPGQEYYGLSEPGGGGRVLEIDSITITVNNAPYPLTPRTQQWMDREQSLPSIYTGQPDSYAIYADQLRLFPVPDNAGPGGGGSYDLTLSTLAQLGPSPLVGDEDTNAWMTDGEQLIRAQALRNLYRFPLRDADGRAMAEDMINEAMWNLKRKMAAKAYTGTIRPWCL